MAREDGVKVLANAGAFFEADTKRLDTRDERALFLEWVRDVISPQINPDKRLEHQTIQHFLTASLLGELLDGKPVLIRHLPENEIFEKTCELRKSEYVLLCESGLAPWIIFFKENTLFFGKKT